jgi:hypothetical protein
MLDTRYAIRIATKHQSVDDIEVLLITRGAPDICFIVSEIDGKELELHIALQQTVGRGMGTILLCISGKLAYYEGEDTCKRYIIFRAGM